MISFQFRTNSSIAGVITTERYQELTLEGKPQILTHLEEEIVDLTAKIEEARKAAQRLLTYSRGVDKISSSRADPGGGLCGDRYG